MFGGMLVHATERRLLLLFVASVVGKCEEKPAETVTVQLYRGASRYE